jgi:hypothetical protein
MQPCQLVAFGGHSERAVQPTGNPDSLRVEVYRSFAG